MPLRVTQSGGRRSFASMTAALTSALSAVQRSPAASPPTRLNTRALRRRGQTVQKRLVKGEKTRMIAVITVRARFLCWVNR